jgi:hypothetical protein
LAKRNEKASVFRVRKGKWLGSDPGVVVENTNSRLRSCSVTLPGKEPLETIK